jgi:serine phosphatase RsbU (regulator of sigma subunit)
VAPLKILSIDDEYMIRRTIIAYLEDSGFTMFEAENGRIGLEVFRKEKPDLVLTDLQMPEMGGLEVLKNITKESPETPVVVISGAGGMNDVIEALRLGAWDYLTKPITDLAVLEHTVHKCLERARLIAENVAYRGELERANDALKKNLAILEEDQEAGRSVQLRLLPEAKMQFGDFHFEHSVVPSLYLSGDFIDYFVIEPDIYGFYLADVSGHGASSAFITILLKSLVSRWLSQHQVGHDKTILEPAQLLKKLSEEIYLAKLGKYLTMFYGVLDDREKTMVYSIAGHYPNPILINGGKASFLKGKGFPVGIMKQVTYEQERLSLTAPCSLVCFSDGVMEVLSEATTDEKEKKLLSLVETEELSVPYFNKVFSLEEKKARPDDVTCLMWRMPTSSS